MQWQKLRRLKLCTKKKRKKDIAQLEVLLETKQCMKRFTPESLGQGHPKGGGASARKLRHEVLDRMSRTGLSLSARPKKTIGNGLRTRGTSEC